MDGHLDTEWTTDHLIGGHTALDFVNTAGGSTKVRDVDRLTGYPAVLRWCLAASVLTSAEADDLNTRSAGASGASGASGDEGASGDAASALVVLREFRESLHMCLVAQISGSERPAREWARVESHIRNALTSACLQAGSERYHWNAVAGDDPISLPLTRVALAVEDLLRSEELSRLRACDRCSWLFLDRGRGRPRRWCSMATCGSRAKSARHYHRQKHGTDPTGG